MYVIVDTIILATHRFAFRFEAGHGMRVHHVKRIAGLFILKLDPSNPFGGYLVSGGARFRAYCLDG